MGLLELALRITIGFLVLLVLTRIMGRKEISQLTFFNFVSAIALGSLTANLVLNASISIRNGVLALVGWTLFTLLFAFIDIKSLKARKLLNGEPTIVIQNGRILEKALKQHRLDLDSLNTMLRQNDVFSTSDVEYAIYETNGKLSVLKNEAKQPLTKGALDLVNSSSKTGTPAEATDDRKEDVLH